MQIFRFLGKGLSLWHMHLCTSKQCMVIDLASKQNKVMFYFTEMHSLLNSCNAKTRMQFMKAVLS